MAEANQSDGEQTCSNICPQECKTMTDSLSVLCCSPEMADIQFVFPESSIRLPAHRFALAIRSSVFKAMFFGSLPEQSDEIVVTDVPPDIFTSLLRYERAYIFMYITLLKQQQTE